MTSSKESTLTATLIDIWRRKYNGKEDKCSSFKRGSKKIKKQDNCLITGTIYILLGDAAHKGFVSSSKKEKHLLWCKGPVIYMLALLPAKPGSAIGSAGPNDSLQNGRLQSCPDWTGRNRHDYKGKRSPEVIEANENMERFICYWRLRESAWCIARRIRRLWCRGTESYVRLPVSYRKIVALRLIMKTVEPYLPKTQNKTK